MGAVGVFKGAHEARVVDSTRSTRETRLYARAAFLALFQTYSLDYYSIRKA